MTPPVSSYRRVWLPAEVIQSAMWLHYCLSLVRSDVELILVARGVAVGYESIREWGLRFGRLFASTLGQHPPRPGDKWHLDERFIHIRDNQH